MCIIQLVFAGASLFNPYFWGFAYALLFGWFSFILWMQKRAITCEPLAHIYYDKTILDGSFSEIHIVYLLLVWGFLYMIVAPKKEYLTRIIADQYLLFVNGMFVILPVDLLTVQCFKEKCRQPLILYKILHTKLPKYLLHFKM